MKIVWKESGVIWKYVQVTPRLYWKYAQLTLDSPENIFKRLRSHFMGESIQSAKPVFSWGSLVGSATAREILNFILHRDWQHANLRCHITIVRGIPRRLEMAGALLIVPLRALTLQRCRGHFRAISILLRVMPSHTQRRFQREIDKSRGLWVRRSMGV